MLKTLLPRFRFTLRHIGLLTVIVAIIAAWSWYQRDPQAIPEGMFKRAGTGGLAEVVFERGGRYGYLDTEGRVAIAAEYSWATAFLGDFAVAREERDVPLAVINRRGKVVLRFPAEADSAFPADDGLFWFCVRDQWGLIDVRRQILIEPTYHNVSRFSGGLARVHLGGEWEFPGVLIGGHDGYVNRLGELVIPCQFENAAWDFADGYAVVGNRLIDATGAVQFEHVDLDNQFAAGLVAIHDYDGQSTSYVDATGKERLRVEGIGEAFRDGLARVRVTGEYGYVDNGGNVVIAHRFAAAGDFHHGLAAATEDGIHWGYIDRTGQFVTPTHFNQLKPAQPKYLVAHIGGIEEVPEDADAFWAGGRWIMLDRAGRPLTALSKDPDSDLVVSCECE